VLSGLFDSIDPRPLGLARVIIGSAALIKLYVTVPVLVGLTDPALLNTPYANWMPAPTLPGVTVIAIVWGASALLFALGWRVGITGTALFAAIVATLALDQQTYANHVYLMAWLVLLLTLSGAGSGINFRRVDVPVTRWPVLLLMAQLSIVYGFSGLTKLNASFLSGSVLAGTLGRGLVPFPESLRTPTILAVVAAIALFVELFIAIFIWRARFRPAAFLLGLGLHASITLSMAGTVQLLVFALEMLALYPLFLTQERLAVVWDEASERCEKWVRTFRRLDVLRTVDPVAASDSGASPDDGLASEGLALRHQGKVVKGFEALAATLEHLVPTLWFAPLLRIPGVRSLCSAWYRRALASPASPVAESVKDSSGR
jgi:hypothetical protein